MAIAVLPTPPKPVNDCVCINAPIECLDNAVSISANNVDLPVNWSTGEGRLNLIHADPFSLVKR